jgi:carbon-monoxide dehydrogenase small subunit
MKVTVNINGVDHNADVEPRVLLVDFIRTNLAMTGTHVGCDTTGCGACTVLLDGEPVKSCTMLTVQVAGRKLTTVEGLGQGAALDPIQTGFYQEHGLQCGFCTPGMLLVGASLLARNPNPTEAEIRWAISGNICRCTGYMNIVKAIKHAARLQGETAEVPAGSTQAVTAGGA